MKALTRGEKSGQLRVLTRSSEDQETIDSPVAHARVKVISAIIRRKWNGQKAELDIKGESRRFRPIKRFNHGKTINQTVSEESGKQLKGR